MNLVLLGPPGAGKGTQGERIAERLGVPKLATGDVLRAAVRDGTAQGLRAKAFMERGDLVPDDVILGIMKEALGRDEASRGVVLDGVVRTVPQAEGLHKVMLDLGRKVDAVLMFDVGEDELIRRLSGRTVCETCQTPYAGGEAGAPCPRDDGGVLVRRKDDQPEAIRNRMGAYKDQTAPVIQWYGARAAADGTRLIRVDAAGTVEQVTTRVMDELAE